MVPEGKAKARKDFWITTEIRKLINNRFKALKKHKATKAKGDWEEYKRLRNQIVREMRKAESQHWLIAFQQMYLSPQSFWGLVKKVQNKKRRKILEHLK